jgi:hypothetical protein
MPVNVQTTPFGAASHFSSRLIDRLQPAYVVARALVLASHSKADGSPCAVIGSRAHVSARAITAEPTTTAITTAEQRFFISRLAAFKIV